MNDTNGPIIFTGEDILTDLKFEPWQKNIFEILDAYISSRSKDDRRGQFKNLDATWNYNLDKPPGYFHNEYKRGSKINFKGFHDDVDSICKSADAQHAVEDLRQREMETISVDWSDSSSVAAKNNFDANKQVTITNINNAIQHANAIKVTIDSIQKLLETKKEYTQTALNRLISALRQNDVDFEKKMQSALDSLKGDEYFTQSAEWTVTEQPRSQKWAEFCGIASDPNIVKARISQYNFENKDEEKLNKVGSISVGEDPTPTIYKIKLNDNTEEFLTNEELVRLKQECTEKLRSSDNSGKYYVPPYVPSSGEGDASYPSSTEPPSEFQIWKRSDLSQDLNRCFSCIDLFSGYLIHLNENIDQSIRNFFNIIATHLDNINDECPPIPATNSLPGGAPPGVAGGSGSGSGGSSGSGAGVGGAGVGGAGVGGGGAGVGGAGVGGGGAGIPGPHIDPGTGDQDPTRVIPQPAAPLPPGNPASPSPSAPTPGPGALGGGGAGQAMGAAGQALGAGSQGLGQAASGLQSSQGGMFQGLMGGISNIIDHASQAAEKAHELHAHDVAEADAREKEEQEDREKDEKESKDENTDSDKNESAQDGKKDESAHSAATAVSSSEETASSLSQTHSLVTPAATITADPVTAASASGTTSTVPAGFSAPAASQSSDPPTRVVTHNVHGEFEVEATVTSVKSHSESHTTGFS